MSPLRYSLILTIATVLVLVMPHRDASGQTLQIDALKANYIDGFLDFVRWQGLLKQNSAAVGVIGSQELVNHLSRLNEPRSSARSLTVRRIDRLDELEDLDALYVGPGRRQQWQELRQRCAAQGILLIGEEEGFAAVAGSIEFVLVKNRLRFIVNPRHAAECGIEFSSKLLELALPQQP